MLFSALDNDDDDDNICFKCVTVCVLSCIGAALEALNRLAYANMAISGDAYCKSAWNGFMLNLKHLVKFFLAETIGGAMIGMGKFIIVLLSTISVILILIYGHPGVFSPIMIGVIAVFTFILSAFISQLFLGLFDEAIICILQCVAIDMDLHAGMPRFGSESFRKSMNFEVEMQVKDTERNLVN